MPLYNYRCKKCGQEWETMLSISNRKTPEADPCPKCHQQNSVENYIAGAPALGDPVRLGFRRPDNGFRETLQRIDEKTAGSKLRDSSNLTRM